MAGSVPESVLKRRKRDEEWAAKKAAAAATASSKAKAQRKVIFKKAEAYAKTYLQQARVPASGQRGGGQQHRHRFGQQLEQEAVECSHQRCLFQQAPARERGSAGAHVPCVMNGHRTHRAVVAAASVEAPGCSECGCFRSWGRCPQLGCWF